MTYGRPALSSTSPGAQSTSAVRRCMIWRSLRGVSILTCLASNELTAATLSDRAWPRSTRQIRTLTTVPPTRRGCIARCGDLRCRRDLHEPGQASQVGRPETEQDIGGRGPDLGPL